MIDCRKKMMQSKQKRIGRYSNIKPNWKENAKISTLANVKLKRELKMLNPSKHHLSYSTRVRKLSGINAPQT